MPNILPDFLLTLVALGGSEAYVNQSTCAVPGHHVFSIVRVCWRRSVKESFKFVDNLGDNMYIADPKRLKASIREPPCKCADCEASFYTTNEQEQAQYSYYLQLSDREAQNFLDEFVKNIHEGREWLLMRLDVSTDVLMSRWKKMSVSKRQEILMSPDVAQILWTNVDHPRWHSWEARDLAHKCQMLLPWLSVETFKSIPTLLFALLHYRTMHHPRDWATFDFKQITSGWAYGHFNAHYSPKAVVIHGEDYGKLVDWDKGSAHRGDILGFPRASLVFEAQAWIMKVLCRVAETILDDIDPNDDSVPIRVYKWKDLTRREAFKETGEVGSVVQGFT